MQALSIWGMLVIRAVQLTWTAPEGCPHASEVRQELSPALVGEARATVTPNPEGFWLELSMNGSTRTLQTLTCSDAARATVFFIRLGLQKAELKSAAESETASW